MTSSTTLPPSFAVGRDSRAARTRRVVGRALLLVPGLAVVASDLSLRAPQIARYTRDELSFYALTALLSVVLWGALTAVAARRDGIARQIARVALAVAAIAVVGGQLYAFHRYGAFLNHRAVLVGTSMLPSVGQQLWSDRASFLRAVLPPVLVALLLPMLLERWAPTRRDGGRLGADVALLALLAAVFYGAPSLGGEQGATPDVLYLSSMGRLAWSRWSHGDVMVELSALPGTRTPIALPAIEATPPVERNVVLIVTESVRAMDVCVAYDPDCKATPFSNALTPGRIPLRQVRALTSTTAISIGVMWSGLPAVASRKEWHTMPLAWEYAHAAGYATAYWTSQNLFFANSGRWLEGLPLDAFVSATQLDPDPGYELGADDGALVDRALEDLPKLREPFFSVVHLSNTHFPYKIDPDDAPFQPQRQAFGDGDALEVHNRYKDAIYLQDRHVARFLAALRARPEGARTVVLFVSDHGEQIREFGAIGHTDTVHDVEVRVPMWIDAPRGTLTAAEEATLRSLAEKPLTLLDVLPTLLDLLGLHDAPALAGLRARLPGRSLLRGGSSPEEGVVLTNCTELFACAFKDWGAMRGKKKLIATQSDAAWKCFDVESDPEEQIDLGEAACPGLKALAEGGGRGAPF